MTQQNTNNITLSKQVQKELMQVGDVFRAKHPWMIKQQDAIGFGIFSISILAILATSAAYGFGYIPAWATVVINAFFMSLLHELEHDLIHYMYFRKNTFMHNLMMGGVWIFRPSTINPWTRRRLHLHHHKFSGSTSDLEERGITNGERWGLRRFIMTGDHMMSKLLRQRTAKEMVRNFIIAQGAKTQEDANVMVKELIAAYKPWGLLHYFLWYTFLIWQAVMLTAQVMGNPIQLGSTMAGIESVLTFIAVVLLIPNVLRVFSLHFVSSNMHYYGDVEPGNVIQQTQVWNAAWLLPFHLFCFNFGATHAIHHFVVRDPFYVRQMTARNMYPILRKHGVRFNDFGTFKRANRWSAGGDFQGA